LYRRAAQLPQPQMVIEHTTVQVHSRGEGRNSTSAELRAIEDTMHEEAEHKAAYAGMPLSSFASHTASLLAFNIVA